MRLQADSGVTISNTIFDIPPNWYSVTDWLTTKFAHADNHVPAAFWPLKISLPTGEPAPENVGKCFNPCVTGSARPELRIAKIHCAIMARKLPSQKSGNRFQYEFPDPATDGTWHISPHRALTAEEIERRLRFIVSWGVKRPKMNEISTLKWPRMLYGGYGQNAGHHCAQGDNGQLGGRWRPVIRACPLRQLMCQQQKGLSRFRSKTRSSFTVTYWISDCFTPFSSKDRASLLLLCARQTGASLSQKGNTAHSAHGR